MKVSFYRDDCWNWSENLWEGLSLEERLNGKKPYVIAFVGAGGKTSLIRRLAWEGRARGRKVLVATTTHMFRPAAYGVLSQRAEDVAFQLEQKGLAVAGRASGEEKIAYVGDELYGQICPLADLVLVEADGSKRLPVKAPRPGEPVVPENADMVLAVLGLSALGEPAEEKCFRLEQACRLMDEYGRKDYRKDGRWILKPEDLACLMENGYGKPLRLGRPELSVLPVFNQADGENSRLLARKLLEQMGETGGIVSGELKEDPSSGLF